MINRRTFLAASTALLAGCTRAAAPGRGGDPSPGKHAARFEEIGKTLGPDGRLGVAALDAGSGRWILHDADSRYAMASTFKFPLAAAILAEVDRGRLKLDALLPFAPEDPLANSPMIEANLARRALPVEQLSAAIVERSDNSAANILLRRIGGPAALTRFIRAAGDDVTRLDRYELELNSNLPGDPRDTTSPRAMAQLARTLVLGNVLTQASRDRLVGWLKSAVPGPDRLRAGIPADWTFGHKTGTGARGAHNDVGIAWPPGRPPIVIASYESGGNASPNARAAAHAAVARLLVEAFA
jgi:beta-lactamase class A